MNYNEWKQHVLNTIMDNMRKEGYVPEAIEEFLEVQSEMLDFAFNLGIKEGGGDGTD